MPPQTPIYQTPGKSSSRSLITSIVLGVLLLGSLAFAISAYQSKQSLKSSSDQKIAAASLEALKANQDLANLTLQLKAPYKSFAGPSTYGSIKLSYPKTWSAYVDQTSSSEPINGYFYPNVVPSINGTTAFALRVELLANTYASVVQQYQSQVQQGALKASAYVPTKLAKVAGVQRGTRYDGAINSNQTGAMIIIPVRDQTLQISTQSTDFLSDFNSVVLPSLTFSP